MYFRTCLCQLICLIDEFNNLQNMFENMKTFLPLLLFLLFLSCEQKFDYPENLIDELELRASDSNYPYHIYVALPAAYDKDRAESYPVIYLLDGDDNIKRVADIAHEQAKIGQKAAIVVGIGYGSQDDERNRDYTPTAGKLHSSGGAEDFLNFIQNDLFPKIETDYNTTSTPSGRLLAGHSLGGLLSALCFVNNTDLFQHYLILSPSLWWDEQVFFAMEAERRATIQDETKTIYLGIGALESLGMNPVFELFAERLEAYYPNILLKKHRVEAKGHNDSKPENLEHGIQFFLENL